MRNFFSFILVSLFGFVFIIGLVTFDLKSTFLSQETVKKVLVEGKVYETVVADTLPQLLASLEGEEKGKPLFPKGLTQDLLKKVIEPSTLQKDIETIVDGLLPYLKSEKDTLDVKIDLIKYKQKLSQNIEPSVAIYLDSLPECKKTVDLEKIESLPDCRPKGKKTSELIKKLPLAELETSLIKLPNELIIDNHGFKLNPPLEETEQLPTSETQNDFDLASVRNFFRIVNLAVLACVGLAVFFLLLIAILWWGKFHNSLRWLGVALISASFIPTVIALAMLYFLREGALENLLRDRTSGESLQLQGAINSLAPLLKHFWSLMLTHNALAMVVGSLFFIGSKFLEKKAQIKT